MATPITIGSSYFEDFTNGQGAGASNYFTYAQDMDVNFQTLRVTVNDVIAEVNAINGPNSLIGLDLVTLNDVTQFTPRNNNKIGSDSYEVSINGNDLDVKAGEAVAAGVRVTSTGVSLAGSGAAGNRWVALDVNGVPTLQTAAAQGVFDIATATWNNPGWSGLVNINQYSFDGDNFEALRTEDAGGTSLPASTYRQAAGRVRTIAELVSGFNVNDAGSTLGPIVGSSGNTAALPGLTCGPGDGTFTAGLGLFRSTTSALSFSSGSAEQVRFSGNGVELKAGSAGTASLGFIGDTDTGLYSPGANQLGVTVGGTQAQLINAQQQRTSATQGRLAATATGETHDSGTGTWDVVDVDNAHILYDVAGYHAGGSPSTITVPTGGNGNYTVKAWARFAANVTGERGIRITAGGAVVAEMLVPTTGAGVCTVTCSADVDLVATNTMVIEVYQSSGGNLGFDYRTSLRLED